MTLLSIILIALALSIDAFGASLSCSIRLGGPQYSRYLKVAFFFGFFQAIMPIIGWFLGQSIHLYLTSFSHIIIFFIFFMLGTKIIYDAIKNEKTKRAPTKCQCNGFKCIFILSIATSIDALLIGVVLSLSEVSILWASSLIGLITFIISLIGCFLGRLSHIIFGKWTNFMAGFILIILALKSLFYNE